MLSALFRIMLCASCFACMFFTMRLACARAHMLACAKQSVNLEDILRDRALCFFLFGFLTLVIASATSFWLLIPGFIASWIFAVQAPRFLDDCQAKETRCACDEHIDTMADIISMGVQSGLSFDAALALYCSKFDNELAQQLHHTLMEWKSGLTSRSDALLKLAESIQSKALKRFAETSIQAIHHGSPLAHMLSSFSSDIRQRKRNAIERQIAKAPIKMLIPTGTCILPAMLILVMGPVLLQFIQTNM